MDVPTYAPVLVDKICPVGDQAAASDEKTFEVNRRQFVTRRQFDDQIAMDLCKWSARDDKSTIRGLCERGDSPVNLGCVSHVDRDYFHPERGRRGLYRGELARPGRNRRISQNRNAGRAWRNFPE